MANKSYSQDEKLHFIGLIKDKIKQGLSVERSCKEVGIAKNTYSYWVTPKKDVKLETLIVEDKPILKALYIKGTPDQILALFEKF